MKTYEINTKKAISETLDGETIVINLESGTYYSINASGTVIWNSILKNEPLDIAEKQIANFIDFLQTEQLIMETQTPSNASVTKLELADAPVIQKYNDMQEMLLADPIHDVDNTGWPALKKQ